MLKKEYDGLSSLTWLSYRSYPYILDEVYKIQFTWGQLI